MTAFGLLARPGALVYRSGNYDSFLAAMQAQVRGKPPLATLNLEIEGDFTNALMSGWARVCDVLSFYQERIANEGYLATAVEPASIGWLGAEIGERRRPAVGAQAQIAFQLIAAAGQPQSLFVNPGPALAVQNAPASTNQLPVVFECAERRELRVGWNALAPVVPPVVTPASIWPGCRSLRVVGTSLGLRPGGALLLTADCARSWLVIADTVQVDRALGCTMVSWLEPAPLPKDQLPLPIGAVTQFTRNAGLFGRSAMDWSDVPEGEKQAIGVRAGGVVALDRRGITPDPRHPGPGLWARPAGSPPPPDNIQALLGAGADGLLAGTGRGLFRSRDRGSTWEALTLPQPNGWNDVLSLDRDRSGTLHAGTAAGLVLRSADGGETWAAMTGTVLPGAGGRQGMFQVILEDLHIKDRPASPAKWTLASPVRAIVSKGDADALPSLYIGTDQGVFAMQGDAAPWQPFNAGFPGFDETSGTAALSVFALAVVDGDMLVAATNRGAFWTGPGTGRWTAMELDPLGKECSSLAAGPGAVFVGTPGGVKSFVLVKAAGDFVPGRVWLSQPVSSLAIAGETLYAATRGGIQCLEGAASPSGPGRGASPQWDPLDVEDLSLFRIDSVFAAGLEKGTLSPALRERFERFGILLDADVEVRPIYEPISSLGARVGWEIREGQPSARIFRIYDETPLRVTQLVLNLAGPGDRIAATDEGPVASLSLGPVVNCEWPDFAVQTGEVTGDAGVDGAEIYLDRKIDGIEDGSQLAVTPSGTSLAAPPEVHKVIASEAVLRKAYGKQGIVTRIVVEPTEALLAADLRSSDVHLLDRPLGPFAAADSSREPLTGPVVTLPGVHRDLAPGRSLQFSGPRPGAVIVARAGMPKEPVIATAGPGSAPALDQQMIAPELGSAFTAAGLKLSPGASVLVGMQSALWLVRDGDLVWRIDLEGDAGHPQSLAIRQTTLYELISRPVQGGEYGQPYVLQCGDEVVTRWEGAIMYQRAASTQTAVGEIATIARVAVDTLENVTTVTLTAPLRNPYDSALCRICANVVLATQGETVQGEVLGSGQPAEAGQSFTLHRSPLTYTRDRFGYDLHRRLEVLVNGDAGRALRFGGGLQPVAPAGAPWREIGSLALAGPAERVFSLTTDDAGRTTLHFGDGVHGARLPSGTNNVTATYRTGAGKQGNVAAGTLIALRKRPPGIRSATNPEPASGGTDAESIEAFRRRAPRRFDCSDRIVTLKDYEDFARAQAGVGRAQAVLIEPRIVWLTAVTSDWLPISLAPLLEAELARSIRERRADSTILRIEDPAIVPFDVSLEIELEPHMDSVETSRRVKKVLARRFGPAARGFGEGVDPQEVAAAARVPGVAAVDLTSLFRSFAHEALGALTARPAGRDSETGGLQPVEWLLINADGGIRVSVKNG